MKELIELSWLTAIVQVDTVEELQCPAGIMLIISGDGGWEKLYSLNRPRITALKHVKWCIKQ